MIQSNNKLTCLVLVREDVFISANFIKKIYTFWSTCISFVYRCIFLWKIPTTYMQVTQVFLSQDDCLFCFNGFFSFQTSYAVF